MVAPCSAVNHLRWDLSAQQIAELTTELIEQTKRVYDRVGAQEPQDVSYENTLKALADVEVSYTGEPCPDLATPPPSQGPSGERHWLGKAPGGPWSAGDSQAWLACTIPWGRVIRPAHLPALKLEPQGLFISSERLNLVPFGFLPPATSLCSE